MLLSNSNSSSKISERDRILADALAYVESIERKLAEREQAAKTRSDNMDRDDAGKSAPASSANA